jgi:hypothetical protein
MQPRDQSQAAAESQAACKTYSVPYAIQICFSHKGICREIQNFIDRQFVYSQLPPNNRVVNSVVTDFPENSTSSTQHCFYAGVASAQKYFYVHAYRFGAPGGAVA